MAAELSAHGLTQFNIQLFIMSALRLNDEDMEDEYFGDDGSDADDYSQVKIKGHGKPGRPRGKGRPKKSQKGANRKMSEDEESWEERAKVREKPAPQRQEPAIEGYIRIIDYLKKIDYDEVSILNKMNPYNALTAASYWYAISAEYFSHDFFSGRQPSDTTGVFLDRIHKLPLLMPQRVSKIQSFPSPLEFETEELAHLGAKLGEKMNLMIPSPMPHYSPPIQRRLNTTSVAQDDEFICSTRAMIYNYINNKMKSSEKWAGLMDEYGLEIEGLPKKEMERVEAVDLSEEVEELQEASLFELLKLQAKKKVLKREKKEKKKSGDLNQIFDSSEGKEEQEEKNLEEKIEEELRHSMMKIEAGAAEHPMQAEGVHHEQQPQKMEQQLPEDQSEQQSTFVKQYDHQDALLDGILHMPIDKVISILQSSLPTIQLPEPEKDFMPMPTKDPLEFVFQLHPEEEKYMEYLKEHKKKKYRQKMAQMEVEKEEVEKEEQFEDAKCQICTDGDYTDDNLIVFCSMCNISLHQRCVGLTKVPSESWVCDVCAAFGPAGCNLPCPLCNIKGGAMKRTNIHIDTHLFKDTNPGYHEYAKRCPFNKNKEEYNPREVKQEMKEQGEEGVRVVRDRGDKQEECYYDYFVKSTYPTHEPFCHYVWVHYVCSIWVPECYFQEKNGVISVKGIENIDKKRFKHECFVCKKTKGGVAIKCEEPGCDKYYHPECARKKKVYMEQLNLQKLKYLIFCEQHQPLKLTRQIEYRKKKNREEIVKFARMIEKYIETYRIAQFPYRLMKSAHPAGHVEIVKADRHEQKHSRHQSIASDEEFLKNLITKLKKAKMMTVRLTRNDNGYEIAGIDTPSKREIRKCLNRYDEFWTSLTNGETGEDNFRRYERIMQENFELKNRLEAFLNGSLNQKQKTDEKKEKRKKRGKHVTQQMGIQEEGGIFCICRRPYRGQTDMIECQICNEWYHFGCLGFIGQQSDAQGIQFKCMKCMKFEDDIQKEERLKKYRHLFRQDSVMYNYRPPTPQLMSEEEVDNKNYNQIMEEVERSKHKFIGGKKASSKDESARKKTDKKGQSDKNKSPSDKPAENEQEVPVKAEEKQDDKRQDPFIITHCRKQENSQISKTIQDKTEQKPREAEPQAVQHPKEPVDQIHQPAPIKPEVQQPAVVSEIPKTQTQEDVQVRAQVQIIQQVGNSQE